MYEGIRLKAQKIQTLEDLKVEREKSLKIITAVFQPYFSTSNNIRLSESLYLHRLHLKSFLMVYCWIYALNPVDDEIFYVFYLLLHIFRTMDTGIHEMNKSP